VSCAYDIALVERDPTHSAFKAVPRRRFVIEGARRFAHLDMRLPIGLGHWTPSPSLLAKAATLLDLRGDEHILEVGCGTGYFTAILALLGGAVVALDRTPSMVEQTRANLESLGLRNFRAVVRNGHLAYDELGPYDVIVVGAAVATIPASLMAQLDQNGRLLVPIGGHMTLLNRAGRKLGGFAYDEPIEALVGP
jgi:protein-L-isoaspartate(D-aspartate) O-methyltransferase